MRKPYHSSIFYPEDKNEMLRLTLPLEKQSAKKAVIVPHQDLRLCFEMYRKAFSYIPDGSNIIALLPIHNEKLLKDDDSIVFEPECLDIETPIGEIHLSSLGIKKAEYYLEEEYSAELILPYVLSSCPNSKLSIVFVKAITSEECKKLSRLIEKWNNINTYFIISSNLAARMPDDEKKVAANRAISMLENGESLLDSYRKGHISMCASSIVDAFGRVIPGKWKMLENDEKASCTHASFYKESI